MKIVKYIQLVLSIAILGVLVRYIDVSRLLEVLKEVQLFLIMTAFGITLLCAFLKTVRWNVLLRRAVPDVKFGLVKMYNLVFSGIALDTIIPGGVGEIGKSYYAYKQFGKKEEFLSTSILDRIVALLALTVYAFVSSVVNSNMSFLLLSSALIVVLLIIVLYPAILPWRMLEKLFGFFRINISEDKLKHAITTSLVVKLEIFLISMVIWFFTFIQLYVICIAFGIFPDVKYFAMVSPLFYLARLIPVTVNGIGVQEAVFAFLLNRADVDPSVSVGIALISRVINYVLPGLYGLVVMNIISFQSRRSGSKD